jgi:nitroimidazol reductase NimA-like FMN-containing flavoprotein (pyridoxamine 5'-phosphate oxidase superfamily)
MSTHILWRSVESQLQNIRTIWLNTTRRDGHAHSVPICYWWEDDGHRKRIYLVTAVNTVKAQNLAYNPRVTLQT